MLSKRSFKTDIFQFVNGNDKRHRKADNDKILISL